jgi:ATP-dependent helicase/nuclease subunit B
MEPESAMEIDAGLRSGLQVVAASERAARALAAAYHRARRAEGLTAWPAPDIVDWDSFLRTGWNALATDDRMVLSAAQEQSLWTEIVACDRQHAVLLEGPRQRVAQLAMNAHRLLCLYAPRYLPAPARTRWQQDAGAFSRWLAAFDTTCRAQGLLSAARLPLELAEILKAGTGDRPPLLLAGFDRILPAQQALLDVWGPYNEVSRGHAAEQVALYEAADEAAELAACALWCKSRLDANPAARLLIITQDASGRRGEIERAFQRFATNDTASELNTPPFEFSLGVPLIRVELARAAYLLLRWLAGAIEEQELDWLFSSEAVAADTDESRALTAFMRDLRRRGWQRTQWRMDAFLRQRPGAVLPEAWAARMRQAKQHLADFTRAHTMAGRHEAAASAIDWAELVRDLLRTAGWPGGRPHASAEFQVMRRWERMVDECASLGFDGRPMSWRSFLAALERLLHETLFASESQDAPILIAGPAESAGLAADAIWFFGAAEDAWPARGATHPLLPLELQREAKMPHSSAQLEWDVASAVTERLVASARQVWFSYARQSEGIEARPSRLAICFAGAAQRLPAELRASKADEPQTVPFEDHSRIPFLLLSTGGGSGILTAQSQCPFKAFATARLNAGQWDPAEPALTAAERGQLLHAVLHSLWSGPPHGIRSHAELMQIEDLRTFVQSHVQSALGNKITSGVRVQMPQRYLLLEEERLTDLLTEWLLFERERVPFTVEQTELDSTASIHGLLLRLRMDRVDQLNDGTRLIIDYKTGNVSSKSWELPRPDDVQLPLYAGFGLDRASNPLGGLVFAKVRAGKHSFAGRVTDAKSTLQHNLSARSELVKKPFTVEEMIDWRTYIEQMAADFVAGHAEVDPREYPQTCERCGLEALCRVRETRWLDDDGEDAAEADDA